MELKEPTAEQREEIRHLLAEVPAPLSSPVLLGRFFRRVEEMGVDRAWFGTNPDLL